MHRREKLVHDDESFSRKNFEFVMLITSNHKSIRTHRSWLVLLKRQRFVNQVDPSDETLSRSFDIGSKIKDSGKISTPNSVHDSLLG